MGNGSDVGGVASVSNYTYYYNITKNRCYALLQTLTTITDKRPRSSTIVHSGHLHDVSENRELGSVVIKETEAVTYCELEGEICRMKAEWTELGRPYMQQ